jgi:hypothetical protein
MIMPDLIPKKTVTRMLQSIKKGIPIPMSPHLMIEVTATIRAQQIMINALGLKDNCL